MHNDFPTVGRDSKLGRWEYVIPNVVTNEIYFLWLIPTGKRQMLENAISDSDKKVENLSCYNIYDILKLITFILSKIYVINSMS